MAMRRLFGRGDVYIKCHLFLHRNANFKKDEETHVSEEAKTSWGKKIGILVFLKILKIPVYSYNFPYERKILLTKY